MSQQNHTVRITSLTHLFGGHDSMADQDLSSPLVVACGTDQTIGTTQPQRALLGKSGHTLSKVLVLKDAGGEDR